MLRFVTTDVEGSRFPLPAPLSVTLRMEEDVPADDLYAVFPLIRCRELKEIAVYDGEREVFVGVIDEQELLRQPSGASLRLSARSLAARLLDNEAPPRIYDHPSARLIYERHVRDYGIGEGDVDDANCFGELAITKGMSQWSVLKTFCNACYASVPRVSADGRLYMKGLPRTEAVVFGEGGVRYTRLSEQYRRCEEISRVNVKVNESGGYSYPVENRDALQRGVCRERYVNALLTATPIKCADIILQKGCEKAYALHLRCPERLLHLLGCDAAVHDGAVGDREGLYVSAVRYRMDKGGEYTAVKLKRRLLSCG